METQACDLCGATSARELYTARDRLGNSRRSFSIAACNYCGVLRTLPDMNERELAAFYPKGYWGETDQPSQTWIKRSQSEKTGFLHRCNLRGGRILDVGCGSGFFLRSVDSAAWDRFGVEIDELTASAAARTIEKASIFAGTLLESHYPDAHFDVVTFWSALEHMNHPRRHLIEARRLVRPGGTLIVQVPNAASRQARWFGGDWFALDAPRHRYHFSFETLKRVLNDAGFEVYDATFFSRAHNAHALRQSLKARLWTDDASRSRRALLYLSIPLIKPVDLLMSALGDGATLTVAAR